MIESFAEEIAHAICRGIRREGDVAIGEQQDIPRGRLGSPLGRVVLPEPPRGKLLHMKHPEPFVPGAQTFGDLAGAIVGAVVDEDHFVVVIAEREQ